MARIDKAFENIRTLMESQEIEWLSENGFDPVPIKSKPRRSSYPKKALSGQFAANRFIGAAGIKPRASEPEIVDLTDQKDNNHSRLYNEVVKAIRDASRDGRNTKVIAILIPVVQNGEEFEDLPVSQKIELSPVDEDEDLPPLPNELDDDVINTVNADN